MINLVWLTTVTAAGCAFGGSVVLACTWLVDRRRYRR